MHSVLQYSVMLPSISKKSHDCPGNNQSMKPGDWLCTNCGDLQFARNEACRKLAAQRLVLGEKLCIRFRCLDALILDAFRCGTAKPNDLARSRSPTRRY